MLKIISMLILLICGSVSGFAQVPGYLGKKFTVQGEFHSFPALDGPTASNKGLQTSFRGEGGGFGLNWSAGARLGYVTGRYSQAMLSADYLKTGMLQTLTTPAFGPFGDPENETHELFYNITGFTTGIGIRKFNATKGGLAPMGFYNGYSLSATFLKGEIVDEYTYNNVGGSGHAPHGVDAKHTLLSFGYEIGTNIIIKDRLLLNLGAKFNIPLSPRLFKYILIESGDYVDDSGKPYEEINTDDFKTLVVGRYGLHSFFMIYVGVGLMP